MIRVTTYTRKSKVPSVRVDRAGCSGSITFSFLLLVLVSS